MPEYSSVTGLEGVKFAPLKKENGFYVATKIIDYPYAINAKVNTETSTEKQYADNKLVDMAVTTGSTKLELEMRDLPMEILEELFGIEETDGIYMFKKNVIAPWVAMHRNPWRDNILFEHIDPVCFFYPKQFLQNFHWQIPHFKLQFCGTSRDSHIHQFVVCILLFC